MRSGLDTPGNKSQLLQGNRRPLNQSKTDDVSNGKSV